ncbi:hypothetical protein LMG16407_04774 [Pandoraea apista]|nr:hypothetical protein LMG16407_04774 [Pandoraea apista]
MLSSADQLRLVRYETLALPAGTFNLALVAQEVTMNDAQGKPFTFRSEIYVLRQ